MVDDDRDRDDMFAIRRALQPPRAVAAPNGPTLADDETPPTAASIRETAKEVNGLFRDSDYAGAVKLLPAALADGRRTADALDGADQVVAWVQLAQILQTAALVLTQLRKYDLAYHALGLAMDAGRSAGDDVLVASAVNGENWLLTRQGRFDEAERGALATAEAIDPSFCRSALSHMAVWGWLNLGAAAAATRNNRLDAAGDAMRRARAAAQVAAPYRSVDVAHWTTFNPAVVAMREVELAMVVGAAGRAFQAASEVPDSARPRVTYYRFQLDLAAAHLDARQHDAALEILARLRRDAPGWLRHQGYGRSLVRKLLRIHPRTVPEDLRGIADFLDVTD